MPIGHLSIYCLLLPPGKPLLLCIELWAICGLKLLLLPISGKWYWCQTLGEGKQSGNPHPTLWWRCWGLDRLGLAPQNPSWAQKLLCPTIWLDFLPNCPNYGWCGDAPIYCGIIGYQAALKLLVFISWQIIQLFKIFLLGNITCKISMPILTHLSFEKCTPM